MDVSLAAIADYALIDKGEKVSIIGMFTAIGAPSEPITHPQMTFVMVFEASRGDAGREREWMVDITDADGRTIVEPMRGRVNFDQNIRTPSHSQFLLAIQGLTFPKFGAYFFTIFVDGDQKKQLRLDVLPSEQASAAPLPGPDGTLPISE